MGVQFKIAAQQLVTPVCGSFIAGTWAETGGGAAQNFNFFLGYMHYGGESVAQIRAAARTSPAHFNVDANDDLDFIC